MSFKPDSLAQLFKPPEQHRGAFGWLCGYSADAGFLEDALERFSDLTRDRRAHQGRILLAVMLDPGNPQITPAEPPGALHLPVMAAKLPFALLHAKVAILGFQGADGFVLRVIVSTGNWTRQTLAGLASPRASSSGPPLSFMFSWSGRVEIVSKERRGFLGPRHILSHAILAETTQPANTRTDTWINSGESQKFAQVRDGPSRTWAARLANCGLTNKT